MVFVNYESETSADEEGDLAVTNATQDVLMGLNSSDSEDPFYDPNLMSTPSSALYADHPDWDLGAYIGGSQELPEAAEMPEDFVHETEHCLSTSQKSQHSFIVRQQTPIPEMGGVIGRSVTSIASHEACVSDRSTVEADSHEGFRDLISSLQDSTGSTPSHIATLSDGTYTSCLSLGSDPGTSDTISPISGPTDSNPKNCRSDECAKKKQRFLKNLQKLVHKVDADLTREEPRNAKLRSQVRTISSCFKKHAEYLDVKEETHHAATCLLGRRYIFSGPDLYDFVMVLRTHINQHRTKNKGTTTDEESVSTS